jgi:hypothetical protein
MITKAFDSSLKTLVIGDIVEDPDTHHQYEIRQILGNNKVILRDTFTGEYSEELVAGFFNRVDDFD